MSNIGQRARRSCCRLRRSTCRRDGVPRRDPRACAGVEGEGGRRRVVRERRDHRWRRNRDVGVRGESPWCSGAEDDQRDDAQALARLDDLGRRAALHPCAARAPAAPLIIADSGRKWGKSGTEAVTVWKPFRPNQPGSGVGTAKTYYGK